MVDLVMTHHPDTQIGEAADHRQNEYQRHDHMLQLDLGQ